LPEEESTTAGESGTDSALLSSDSIFAPDESEFTRLNDVFNEVDSEPRNHEHEPPLVTDPDPISPDPTSIAPEPSSPSVNESEPEEFDLTLAPAEETDVDYNPHPRPSSLFESLSNQPIETRQSEIEWQIPEHAVDEELIPTPVESEPDSSPPDVINEPTLQVVPPNPPTDDQLYPWQEEVVEEASSELPTVQEIHPEQHSEAQALLPTIILLTDDFLPSVGYPTGPFCAWVVAPDDIELDTVPANIDLVLSSEEEFSGPVENTTQESTSAEGEAISPTYDEENLDNYSEPVMFHSVDGERTLSDESHTPSREIEHGEAVEPPRTPSEEETTVIVEPWNEVSESVVESESSESFESHEPMTFEDTVIDSQDVLIQEDVATEIAEEVPVVPTESLPEDQFSPSHSTLKSQIEVETVPPTITAEELASRMKWTGDSFTVEEAFFDAFKTISHSSVMSDLNVASALTFSKTDAAQVELYFESAMDFLEGRSITPTQDISVRSDQRVVLSEELEAQGKVTEKVMDQSSRETSLKQLIDRSGTHPTGSARRHRRDRGKYNVVLFTRLFAGALDLGVLTLICFCFAALFEHGGLPAILADISVDGFSYKQLSLCATAVSTLPLVAIIYYALCFIFLGSSLAGRFFDFTLMTETGRPPKLSHILVRAFSMPTSVVIGGYLPIFFGRKALPDYLARTQLVVTDDDLEE